MTAALIAVSYLVLVFGQILGGMLLCTMRAPRDAKPWNRFLGMWMLASSVSNLSFARQVLTQPVLTVSLREGIIFWATLPRTVLLLLTVGFLVRCYINRGKVA